MAVTTAQGGLAQGTGTTVNLARPASKAGDLIQFISYSNFPATPQTTTGYTKIVDGGGFTVWQQVTTVDQPAGNGRLNFAGSGAYSALLQVINGDTANPNQPDGSEAARQAIMGMVTGAVSGLPFNSGVNPAGRSGTFAGHEGIQDTVENSSNRGVPFDVRTTFQYQNRSLSEGSTAWNDLKGVQPLDWFDPARPCVLGFQPFPNGGSYTAAKNGDYDSQLVAIGQTIAAKRPAGTGKVILRLAWEMNGNWYSHAAFRYVDGANQFVPVADYVAGSQRIITKIREGAGDRVEFVQCWSASQNTRYQSTYWGDAYADLISIDVYDAFAGTSNGIHTRAQLLATGLGGMYDFARSRGKLVAIDEWGGHNTAGEATNGNDNADFPVVFYDWLYSVRDTIAYECQFNDPAVGNVENNLYATGGTSVQLTAQRAALISKVRSY